MILDVVLDFVNTVDKQFQHFNEVYFRIFCMNIRVVLNELSVKIPKKNVFIPTISVFMKKRNCV